MDSYELFAQAICDFINGEDVEFVVRRKSGIVDREIIALYYDGVLSEEIKALKYAKGLTLDIGCGAGRHSVYLLRKKIKVIAFDMNNTICRIVKNRGVKIVCGRAPFLPFKENMFDTVLLLGNGFGICGDYKNTLLLFKEIKRITKKGGFLIGSSTEPSHFPEAKDGILHLRAEYKGLIGDWFNLFLLSPDDVRTICDDTGWRFLKIFKGHLGHFVCVLQNA